MNSNRSARFSSLGLSFSPTSLHRPLQEYECSMVSPRFEQQLRRGEKMSRREGETRSSGLDAGDTKASSCSGCDGGVETRSLSKLETRQEKWRRRGNAITKPDSAKRCVFKHSL
ncbi:hypothetical protein Bca52824_018286 [Brassica carinata]|uniref:Uncharacterized protein n=1 Tax=Brassica carinata TaxID=52824 RepID=A0A8X7VP61_BRACI|nr:hypothetical protein Bca52824_018286 [Brassica carinata]